MLSINWKMVRPGRWSTLTMFRDGALNAKCLKEIGKSISIPGSFDTCHTYKNPCIDCKKWTMQGFSMKDYIEERAVEIAYYIIEHKATVRQTAKQFGVSKSTIHMVVTKKNCIEILYIWLNDKRERTINLDVYSFFFFRKILIVNIQNAMFI